MSSFKVPPKLEAHTFTGVASSGGGEDWLDIEGIPVDDSVNGFIFDQQSQKVYPFRCAFQYTSSEL